MAIMEDIHGKVVYLKSADIEDAEFTLQIRNVNNTDGRIPKLDNTIQDQINWINSQRKKEGDYFFIIKNFQEHSVGVVGFYNIDEDKQIFEVGRYVAVGSPIENVEGLILAINTCLENFKVTSMILSVLESNTTVLNFWKSFGAKVTNKILVSGCPAFEMILHKDDYINYRNKIYKIFGF